MMSLSKRRNRKAGRALALLAFFLFSLVGCNSAGIDESKWAYEQQTNAGPDLSASIEFLEERVEKRPRSYLEQAELASYYLQRARAQRSAQDLELSRKWVERSLAEFENNAALLVKADSLQMEHRFAAALALLDKILDSEPGHVAARMMIIRIKLAQGEAEAAAEQLKNLPQSPLSSFLFLRGQVAEANGDTAGARQLYHQAIDRESSSDSPSEAARMRAVLARLELTQGNLDEADALLEAAHAIAVEQPLTEVLRARLLVQKENYTEAASVLRSAYEQYRDPVFLVRLGEVEHTAGNVTGAQKTFATAAELLKADSFGHERDLALALYYLDPKAYLTDIQELMKVEKSRRRDPETLIVEKIIEQNLPPSALR